MSRRATSLWWTEPPIVLVHLAVVLGFARVYEGRSFAGALLTFVLVAHALAIVGRRARVPAPPLALVALVGLVLTATWTLFPDTTSFGLPTGATWDAVRAALQEAAEAFPEVVAPTAPIPGFQLAAGIALWLAAWFADWTAHRLQATAEAVTTGATLFVFCAILGSGDFVELSTIAFAAAVVLFVVGQRAAAVDREHAWLPGRHELVRAVAGGGLVLGALAVGIGTVVGPELPGAGEEAVVDWRRGSDGPSSRVTISPMVELRKRLVEQSDEVLFEVRADEAAYWRLTSLDRFDGEIWSSSGDYEPAERRLPDDGGPDRTGRAIEQQILIRALATIWAPAAFEPIGLLDASEELRWDPDSATLIVDESQETSDGLRYQVLSRVQGLDLPVVAEASGADDPEIVERYGALPADFPQDVALTARQVTAGAETRYEQALALQDWFRSTFTYSLDSPPGHGDDALVDFLDSRTGYCEQFAGAFGAMARSLGIPSRVAVGFTPGINDPADPQRYVVLGRHAHAWPELWFPEIGWVPFEPTPGRGQQAAESYTGVAPAQDDGGTLDPDAATTTTAPTTTTTSTGATPEDPAEAPARTESAAGPTDDERAEGDGPGAAGWIVRALAAIALLTGLAMLLLRRRRHAPPSDPIERAWADVAGDLHRRGLALPDASATPIEVAAAVGPDPAGPALAELADLVTAARWSPGAATPEEQERAASLAAAARAALGDQARSAPSSEPSSVGRVR